MSHTEMKKLSFWMMIASLALPMVILLGSSLWFYEAENESARQRAERQLSAFAHLQVKQITDWRNDRLADANLIGENAYLVKSMAALANESKGMDFNELRNYLRSMQKLYRYSDILLVDPRGKVRMSLKDGREANSEFAKLIENVMRDHRPAFTHMRLEGQFSASLLGVVAPIFSSGQPETPLGAIILTYDSAQFLDSLNQTHFKPSATSETLLVQREGNSVLFINELLHPVEGIKQLRVPLTRSEVIAVMAVSGRVGYTEGKDYRGVDSLAFILPVPNSPWFLVTKDAAAEVLGIWRYRAALLMVVFAVLVGGGGALFLFAWQHNQRSHYMALYKSETLLRENVERHSTILKSIGDGIIATDAQGKVELLNPVAEALTGWSHIEACGQPLEEVFWIINEQTGVKVENPVAKVLREGRRVGLSDHTLLISKNGTHHAIVDSAAPIRDEQGEIVGVVLVIQDQTDEHRINRMIEVQLHLQEYAYAHTLDQLLAKALDEIGGLVESPIGFYHFVDNDQKGLVLQQWSTRTVKEFCHAQGSGEHYSLDQAGIWADCVRLGKPVIHNDYHAIEHKKGVPEGHAQIIRVLVVPVIRVGKVVAVLGVGNKPEKYTAKDLEIVTYLADATWRIFEQKKAEEMILSSERRFRSLYTSMMDAFVITDMDGKIKECNAAYSAMLGYTTAELLQLTTADITPQNWLEYEKQVIRPQLLHSGCTSLYEKEYRRKDGSHFPIELRTFLLFNNDGRPEGMSAIVRDISKRRQTEREREKLQAQLSQAQKMESIGQLAGGVAHDFNNMLGVIIGYTELAEKKGEPTERMLGYLRTILAAAKRSADITRQLLAFARKQTIAPKVLDLNDTVEGMLKMLRRLIGEDIDLAWHPGQDLWPVKIDPSQVDQLLANLCVNARDAISGVGKITIETDMVVFDEEYCADHAGFIPGNFVLLAISDDGHGMEKETLKKIFEPFFTTKKLGQGTGLGLATVYGIIKQNNGFINVYSELGVGTSFKVYLPRYEGALAAMQLDEQLDAPMGNGETILVVEDEVPILELSKAILEDVGYNVLTATTPGEAIGLVEMHSGKIDLLITDVIMPEMNGRELTSQLLAIAPELKTLFMSGYTANVIVHRGMLEDGVHFIRKPFSTHEFAAKVHEVLRNRAICDSSMTNISADYSLPVQ